MAGGPWSKLAVEELNRNAAAKQLPAMKESMLMGAVVRRQVRATSKGQRGSSSFSKLGSWR